MAGKLKNWIDIEGSDAFKGLTPAQQKKARARYPIQEFKIQEALKDIEQNVYNSLRKVIDMLGDLNEAIHRLDGVGESNKVEVSGVTGVLEKGIHDLVDRIEATEEKMRDITFDLKSASFLHSENAVKAIEGVQKSVSGLHIPTPEKVDLKGTEDMLNRINRKIAGMTKEPEKRPTKWVASVSERDMNDDIQTVTLTAVH